MPNSHPREEKRTKVRGQVGEDRRACPARGELNGPRQDPRAVVGEEVRVGVGVRVRVGPVEFKLNSRETFVYFCNFVKKNCKKWAYLTDYLRTRSTDLDQLFRGSTFVFRYYSLGGDTAMRAGYMLGFARHFVF